MPDPDWRQSRPHPETPADSTPPPTPDTNGWKQWLEGQGQAAKAAWGRTDDPVVVSMQVTTGTRSFWYGAEGAAPTPWVADGFCETQPPAEYFDFTRYTRTYPTIDLREYIEVTVKVVYAFPNPQGFIEKTFVLFERTGEVKTVPNYQVWRWERTSWINETNGIRIKLRFDNVVTNEDMRPRIGVDYPWSLDEPLPDDLKPRPRPPEGPKVYYSMAEEGWAPASPASRLLAAKGSWSKPAG